MKVLTRVIVSAVCILAFASVSLAAGEYQKTKDDKTTVWNSDPKPGETSTWFGERDREGYATGFGTITWYTDNGAVYARYFGNMVRGKLDGPVNVHTQGRTAHAFFTNGTRTSPWARGPAMSRRVSIEQAEASRKAQEKDQAKLAAAEKKKAEAERKQAARAAATKAAEAKPEAREIAASTPAPEPSRSPEASTTSTPREEPSPPREVAAATSPMQEFTPATELPSATPVEELSPPAPPPSATPTPSTPTPAPVAKSRPKATPTAKSSPKKSGLDDSLRTLVGPPSALRSTPVGEDSAGQGSDSAQRSTASTAAQLSKEDVILIADAEARNAGYDLNDYHRPRAKFDPSNDMWALVYDRKPTDNSMAAPTAEHFNVTVEDKTKKATVSPR